MAAKKKKTAKKKSTKVAKKAPAKKAAKKKAAKKKGTKKKVTKKASKKKASAPLVVTRAKVLAKQAIAQVEAKGEELLGELKGLVKKKSKR